MFGKIKSVAVLMLAIALLYFSSTEAENSSGEQVFNALKFQLSKNLKAGKNKEALATLDLLKSLGADMGGEMLYYEASLRAKVKEWGKARALVSQYLLDLGDEGKNYKKALRLFVQSDKQVTDPPPKATGKTFRDCAECPEMVTITPGVFRMGDVSGGGEGDEKPVHTVILNYPFAVGKYEITQAEYRTVMGKNLSKFTDDKNPVEQVSWNDAQAFMLKLSAKTGKMYRLLSEAEWEYVARAGTSTKYPWGNRMVSGKANCDGCRSQWGGKSTAPVGSFSANAFGLHDMHGNVREWVQDCYEKTYDGAPGDGSAREGNPSCERVHRGGGWLELGSGSRSADRNSSAPDKNGILVFGEALGFRVARTL